jgi:hypothetical protein
MRSLIAHMWDIVATRRSPLLLCFR